MSLGAGSGLQPMEICSSDAVSAEGLAEVLTCAQLQSLLCFHMPLHLEVLVEEALELRHESFLRFVSESCPRHRAPRSDRSLASPDRMSSTVRPTSAVGPLTGDLRCGHCRGLRSSRRLRRHTRQAAARQTSRLPNEDAGTTPLRNRVLQCLCRVRASALLLTLSRACLTCRGASAVPEPKNVHSLVGQNCRCVGHGRTRHVAPDMRARGRMYRVGRSVVGGGGGEPIIDLAAI